MKKVLLVLRLHEVRSPIQIGVGVRSGDQYAPRLEPLKECDPLLEAVAFNNGAWDLNNIWGTVAEPLDIGAPVSSGVLLLSFRE
jgi:hypothetical protein